MNSSHETGAMLSACESLCVCACVCLCLCVAQRKGKGKDGVKERGLPDLRMLFVCLMCVSMWRVLHRTGFK